MNLHLNTDSEEIVRQQIVFLCRLLNSKNYLAAADGNISFRLSDQQILITPTARNKLFIEASDIAIIKLDGVIVSGNPSGERTMHLEVYKNSNARAIIHAHPPVSIAWSIAKPELHQLPNDVLSEAILALGEVPIAKYARPGTKEMGDVLVPLIQNHRAFILARHGALAYGDNLEEAYNGIERLEAISMILMNALNIANASRDSKVSLTALPTEELAYLKNLRLKLGNKTL